MDFQDLVWFLQSVRLPEVGEPYHPEGQWFR